MFDQKIVILNSCYKNEWVNDLSNLMEESYQSFVIVKTAIEVTRGF